MLYLPDVILDPQEAFEHVERHWKRCKKCRSAGMERARLKDVCATGRELVRAWDESERIYATAEAA